MAAVLAAAFAYQGFNRLSQAPRAMNPAGLAQAAHFDPTAFWLGLALVCLAVVAWDGARPHPTTWPARLAAFMGRHWWELALLLPIVGISVFMFTFRFGDFPPTDFICCEEHIRGNRAYGILELGERPLKSPLIFYSLAGGFLLFGENTLGLRLPLLLAGVLMVPVFYLLLRQLVRPLPALFATALLASSWPLAITGTGSQPSYLATLLFVYLLILGIRRRNTLALFGAGFLAGVLSYEFGPHKAVPIAAGGFLTALVAYRVAFPLPKGARDLLARLWSLVRTNWRSAVVFVGAAMIAVTPLLLTIVQGDSRFFQRVEAQARYRAVGDAPWFFADEWEEQLRTTTKMFTFLGDRDFQLTAKMVDPLTGLLVALGVILAVVTFFRPFRLLFLAWYTSLIVGGALILTTFFFWRFFSVIPAALVLAAFLVDDVGRVVGRWARGPGVFLLALLLLGGGAIYAFNWNADALSETVAKDGGVLGSYERPQSHMYVLCNYLRGRPAESSTYTFTTVASDRGFAQLHETPEQQRAAWGLWSLVWACHDLRAQALAAPAEVWPMRDIPAGPMTWAFVIGTDETKKLTASLGRAIPSKTGPDRIITFPTGRGNLVAYELSAEELKAQQGLFGQYRSGEAGTLLAERVDDVRHVLWDAQGDFSPPFTVQWRGLIYVPQPRRAALTARTSDPTLITVDGQVSYSSQGEEPTSFPRDLLPGWHPVEISLHKETPGGSFALEWVGPEGSASSVARQDLVALSSLAGWTHEREVVISIPLSPTKTQRFDFTPYFSSARVIERQLPHHPGGGPKAIIDEKWSVVWHVKEGREYELGLRVENGGAIVKLDGAPVLTMEADPNPRTNEAVVSVSAGAHRLEIQYLHDGGETVGVAFSIRAPDVPDFAPEFSPF